MEKSELMNLLDALESKWKERFRDARPGCVDDAIDPVFFAWDEDSAASSQDVVVCVGANYGQGAERGPTGEGRRAALGSWMGNYRKAVEALAANQLAERAWREHGWLVGPMPKRPRYFVMTNVVPWITRTAWTKLPEADARALVEAASLRPSHLDELHDRLIGSFAVAHGIDEKTMPHVQVAVRHRWSSYLFYANLSHPQQPGDWNENQARFSFKRWTKQVS